MFIFFSLYHSQKQTKLDEKTKKWKLYYFALNENTHHLNYFSNEKVTQLFIYYYNFNVDFTKITLFKKEPKRERNNRSKSSVFLSTRRLVFQSVSLEISLISSFKSINLLKIHLKNRPYGFQILIKPMNSILNGTSNSKHVSVNNHNHTVHYLSTENQKTFKVI